MAAGRGDHLVLGIGFHWLVNKRDKRVESGKVAFAASALYVLVSCIEICLGVAGIGWFPVPFPFLQWALNNPTVGGCLC